MRILREPFLNEGVDDGGSTLHFLNEGVDDGGSTLHFLNEGVDEGGSTVHFLKRRKGAFIVHSFMEKVKSRASIILSFKDTPEISVSLYVSLYRCRLYEALRLLRLPRRL